MLLKCISQRPGTKSGSPADLAPPLNDCLFFDTLRRPSRRILLGREAGLLVTFGDRFSQSSPEHMAGQEAPSLAFEADVGAHPHHFPLVAAAGVRFAQPDYITGLCFYSH